MTPLSSISSSTYRDLVDYSVVDRNNVSVGTLHSMWSDQETGQLEFLGVKTGWLFGSNHVVPTEGAQVDETNRTVLTNYEAAFIKDAPSIAADAEITEDQEAEIYRYYGMGGASSTTTTATTHGTSTAATTGAAAATGAALTGHTTGSTSTTREAHAGETIEVPLSEEQLRVGKRTVEAGSVRLRKVVHTEIVNQPVEVRREEVIVERVGPGEVHSTDKTAFDGEEIIVPVTQEEVVVGKETVVTGAVRVSKTAETQTQTVSDSVRKEDVEIDRSTVTTTGTETHRDDITRR